MNTPPPQIKSVAKAPYCTKEWSRLDPPWLHLHVEPSPAHTGSHREDTHHLPVPLSLALRLTISSFLSTLSPSLPAFLSLALPLTKTV